MSEPLELDAEDRAVLLELARRAVTDAVRCEESVAPLLQAAAKRPALQARRGLFVSLYGKSKDGARRLRGCVGTMDSEEPIRRSVVELAPRAALEDPRFSPLAAEELEALQVGLSILTPLQPVMDPGTIVAGRDGVQLVRGPQRAVFLPQVAEQHGWGREKLLAELALKAGLGKDGWRDAELAVFGSLTFEESLGA